MKQVLVVYWSGTGNTEAMAQAVAKGVEEAGAAAVVQAVGQTAAGMVQEYDYLAFGCPSMGDEVLEETEMEPFFTEVESMLGTKHVALFGSYDWGDGQWMRDWAERTKAAGASLCGEGLIINLEPDDDALAACRKLGADLAGQ